MRSGGHSHGDTLVGQCEGDCDGDGAVRINELILSVNIALGIAPPRSCPAGQCSEGPPIAVNCTIRAVNNALAGCPTAAAEPTRTAAPSQAVSPQPTETPSRPDLSLAVRAIPLPDEGRVEITADLLHLGGSAVWYRTGCSALCWPTFYRAISFDIIGPDGEEVIIDDPCLGPLYCAEYLEELAPDTSRTQTASVTGTAWVEGESNFQCYGCTTTPLASGHYTVVASFVYRLGQSFADPIQPALTATAGFDWPPVAEPWAGRESLASRPCTVEGTLRRPIDSPPLVPATLSSSATRRPRCRACGAPHCRCGSSRRPSC